MRTPKFQSTFEPQHGKSVRVAQNVYRITAPNGGPYTFHGTNSYLVGNENLAVIDPGPDNALHLEALLQAIDGRPVSHIFVTHTHMDHSPLAKRLQDLTGAMTVGFGPHTLSRPLHQDEKHFMDSSADINFHPDLRLAHDESVETSEWTLRGVYSPGHTANHMAFALEEQEVLFSGDHVMAWATTIVAPPDGSMHDFLASLDRLLKRKDKVYLPGHGGPVDKPRAFVKAVKSHRLMREAAILQRLKEGDRTIIDIVQAIYKDLDPRLQGAAALTVFAHLERLISLGLAKSQNETMLKGVFEAL